MKKLLFKAVFHSYALHKKLAVEEYFFFLKLPHVSSKITPRGVNITYFFTFYSIENYYKEIKTIHQLKEVLKNPDISFVLITGDYGPTKIHS